MTKNNTPQFKDENSTLNNTKNTLTVMQKLQDSEVLSETSYNFHDFIALQKELKNAQNEVTNLKAAQYKFISCYIDQLLCFYENLYTDINKYLELEFDQQKIIHLVNALNEIEELKSYSSKLLDFTEMETDFPPLLNKKIVTKQLLNKVIGEMKALSQAKGISLASIFGNDIPYIMFGDNYRIYRILQYLITNAIERNSSKGEIIVTINVFDKARQEVRYDKPKDLVLQFIVKSSTQFLHKKEQEAIYHINKDSVSIFEALNYGMDINIAIAKQLVYQIGGELDVRSNNEEGTVFVCFLPLTLPLVDNIIDEIE